MNAVVAAVGIMLILSLCRVHVVVALIAGALAGGVLGGLGLDGSLAAFNKGLGGGATVALSYALLGAFAVAIGKSGLAHALADRALAMVGRHELDSAGAVKWLMIGLLLAVASVMTTAAELIPPLAQGEFTLALELPEGTPLAELAEAMGMIAPNMGLYPSNFAVTLGLVYNFLPFMVLPLYAAFEKLNLSLVEAAQDLYASPLKAFWHAVFPQTLPGLLAGVVLVAIPAFGMYVIPELLGGGKGMMLGNLVANQFAGSANWPLGAAGAILMLIATFIGLYAMRRIGKRLGGGEEVVI